MRDTSADRCSKCAGYGFVWEPEGMSGFAPGSPEQVPCSECAKRRREDEDAEIASISVLNDTSMKDFL